MQGYEQQIRDLEAAIDQAEARGDEQEEDRLKDMLRDVKKALKEYKKSTTKRRSTGMMVGGIVLSGVGGVGLVATAILGISISLKQGSAKKDLQAATVTALLGSVTCIGIGIPLAVVGGRKVPKTPQEVAAAPVLFVGPGAAGVRFQF